MTTPTCASLVRPPSQRAPVSTPPEAVPTTSWARPRNPWFTGIPHYGSVRYTNIYPGIDIVYHTQNANVDYDFVLAPGADPNQIELAFDRDVEINKDGDLVLAGLRQQRPHVVQDGHEVASEFQLVTARRARIKLGSYGRTRPLTIDPVLAFSTYLGGPGLEQFGVRLDSQDNVFLCGYTQTPASPSLDPFQQTNLSAQQAALIKMNSDASKIVFFSVFASGLWRSGGRRLGQQWGSCNCGEYHYIAVPAR